SAFGNYLVLNPATTTTNYFQPSAVQSPKGSSYTVCFWMRPDSFGANNVQLVRQSYNGVTGTANVDLDLLPDGSLSFGQMQTTNTGDFHSVRSAPQAVLAGNWYHVAMVRDATNAVLGLYLNGRSMATTNTYGILSPTVTPSLGFAATQDALNNDSNTVRFKAVAVMPLRTNVPLAIVKAVGEEEAWL
ncbi:MAG: LamG domain-containing protein, partial [Verrucomicrobia bacterium]|nr:LamG domain-containing protein [Verrucomicrobiota bacterium]